MAVWYVSDAGSNAMGGQIASTSLLTSVPASTSANALGNWIPLHTGTPFHASRIMVVMGKADWAASAVNTQALFDIGVGISPAESAIVSNIAFGGSLAFSCWEFPLVVAQGSRVVMRIRSAVASKANTFGIRLNGGGFGPEAAYLATTYGAVTTSSRGTVLTAAASTNTKSAWSEIISATTSPARWLYVGVGMANTTVQSAADALMDVGMGVAGSERIIIPDIAFGMSANEQLNLHMPCLFPVNIPVGARLAVRYQATVTGSTAAPNVTLTGFS